MDFGGKGGLLIVIHGNVGLIGLSRERYGLIKWAPMTDKYWPCDLVYSPYKAIFHDIKRPWLIMIRINTAYSDVLLEVSEGGVLMRVLTLPRSLHKHPHTCPPNSAVIPSCYACTCVSLTTWPHVLTAPTESSLCKDLRASAVVSQTNNGVLLSQDELTYLIGSWVACTALRRDDKGLRWGSR